MKSIELTHEDIRALRSVQSGLAACAPAWAVCRLVESELAWIGPPPANEVSISYRGRHVLRECDAGHSFEGLVAEITQTLDRPQVLSALCCV
jgi:hypothetical protein